MAVVGDDTEPGVGRVFLHDSSQRHLCCCCHGVCFVKHDELEVTDGGSVGFNRSEDLFRTYESCHYLKPR